MGQTTGDLIRNDIKELLKKSEYKTTSDNIAIIFNECMRGHNPDCIKSIIHIYGYKLEKK